MKEVVEEEPWLSPFLPSISLNDTNNNNNIYDEKTVPQVNIER